MSIIESTRFPSTDLPITDVLVVDDEDSIRNLLSIAIRRAGLSCDTASDGLVALDRLRTACYSVVLTDLMMPRLDGIGLVQRLIVREPLVNCRPILLVMTAFSTSAALALIADFVQVVIPKPFLLAEVVALIHKCVKLRSPSETESPFETRSSDPC